MSQIPYTIELDRCYYRAGHAPVKIDADGAVHISYRENDTWYGIGDLEIPLNVLERIVDAARAHRDAHAKQELKNNG